MVLGHEIAGIIEEFGPEANPEEHGLKVGDLVILYPWVGCGKCDVCKGGRTNDCDNNQGMFCNYGLGFVNPGGYSTHVFPQNLDILIKVPETIPTHIVCMLPCSVLTAFTALKKANSFLKEGFLKNQVSKLLIVGAGGLGLWCTQIAKQMYADQNVEVTIADITQEKLNVAKDQGADFTAQWKTEFENFQMYMSEVHKTTKNGQYQFDAAIDFVGTSNTFNLAYRSLRRSGSLISVGLYGGRIDVPLVELAAKQYHIQGNVVGTLSDLKECVMFIASHSIKYPPLEYVTLDNINEALDRLRAGKIKGRALIKFE